MKTIDLNFQPLTRTGEKHLIDGPAGAFLLKKLDDRVSTERPALEASIADQLAATNTFQISEDAGENGALSDFEYIRTIVQVMDIDNLLKGQILAKFQ